MDRDYLEKRGKEIYGKLPKRVQREVDARLDLYRFSITAGLDNCDSPIEQLFHIHFVEMVRDLDNELRTIEYGARANVDSQHEIKIEDKTYRVDFFAQCLFRGIEKNFVIECDGHEFHEKTKEQARRDKERERSLLNEGYTVIRFTGSEIWEKPSRCVGEAMKIINKSIGLDDYYHELVQRDLRGDSNG